MRVKIYLSSKANSTDWTMLIAGLSGTDSIYYWCKLKKIKKSHQTREPLISRYNYAKHGSAFVVTKRWNSL